MKISGDNNRQQGVSGGTRRMPARLPGLAAFTLVELLIVMAIIAVLAGLLLPVLARLKLNARINSARQAMTQVQVAVADYRAHYPLLPAIGASGQDVTYGFATNGRGIASNADLMVVLMDIDAGLNRNHAKNSQHQVALFPTRSADTSSAGLSSVDNELRDPWGHPYVITLDGNGDDFCDDALYSRIGVQGENGLVDPTRTGNGPFLLHGQVMIWSLGPDGKADANAKANAGDNKDNILGWK